jgi:LuxR family transcriptional regulator, quorum-sensing system regulator BjaR1
LEHTWHFLERVERAHDAVGVEDCLLEIGKDYGFSSVFGGIVPNCCISPAEVEKRILFQRFPKEWATRYNDRGYVLRDPIVHRLQTDRNPFDWQEAYVSCPNSDDVALIRGEASEFGLEAGFVVPVPLLDEGVAAVSFGGGQSQVSSEDRAVLSFVANYAVGNLLHFRESRERLISALTPREYDCLLWAAEGKTDWETSVILGISKSTVVKHLLAARDKLGAVNKAHAIATALRDKLIR